MEGIKKEKTAEQFEKFMTNLTSAIYLVGGYGGGNWRDRTLYEVYESLKSNGIDICFKVDPGKFMGKIFD